MSNNINNCDNCGEPIVDSHGNRLHHEDCSVELGRARSKLSYAAKSLKADPLWLNEQILRKSYYKYGAAHEFDPNDLGAKGFDFDLYSEEKKVNESSIFCMRQFGFSFLKHKKIIIWKLL